MKRKQVKKDARRFADKRIATQRCMPGEPKLVSKKEDVKKYTGQSITHHRKNRIS